MMMMSFPVTYFLTTDIHCCWCHFLSPTVQSLLLQCTCNMLTHARPTVHTVHH